LGLPKDLPFELEEDAMKGSIGDVHSRRTAGRRVLRAWLIAAALIASGAALPSSSEWTVSAQPSGQRGKPVREDLVQKLTGKKIRLDQQTGRARAATEAEARETVEQLTALLEPPAAEPQIAYRSNGTQVANVDGYFNRTVVARPRADGTFETRCVTTLDEAVAFLSGESVAPLEDR
jgi:hypothetical protein